jgi:hypothetical protein
MSRKFRIGEKVKVVGMSPVKFAPSIEDELGTGKLFKSMLGKVYTVRGFDKYGNVELKRTSPNSSVPGQLFHLRSSTKAWRGPLFSMRIRLLRLAADNF